MESTMSGTPIMEESEEVELTDDDAWEIVKDFIVNDHVPPASDMPAGRPVSPLLRTTACRHTGAKHMIYTPTRALKI